MNRNETALIIGAGSGLSASLARLLASEGFHVALAARDSEKLAPLTKKIQGLALKCDATSKAQVDAAFDAVERRWGVPDLVVYNASFRTRGPVAELVPKDVERALAVCAFAGFLVGQAAAKRMLARPLGSAAPDAARQSSGAGAIFFTGASASVKG
jgi:NAD(P)-dependent dehydrogenase (short-subunit alcohol dehydrogenase family)